MSEKFFQLKHKTIDAFLNVLITLIEADKLGISRNQTKGLNQLEKRELAKQNGHYLIMVI